MEFTDNELFLLYSINEEVRNDKSIANSDKSLIEKIYRIILNAIYKDLENIKQETYTDGYKSGLTIGYKKGREEGYSKGFDDCFEEYGVN